MDYNVPCIAGITWNSPLASSSAWVGLGGTLSEVIQDGSQSEQLGPDNNSYTTWVEYAGQYTEGPEPINLENTSDSNNPNGNIPCGTHLYAKVWSPNNYELGNINNGKYVTLTNHNPYGTDLSTAEFISEQNGGNWGLANFGWVTFKGIGVTNVQGTYMSMINAEHDFYNDYWDWNSGASFKLQNVGSLVNDSGDMPYDDNTITWTNSCPGNCQ